MDAARGSSRVWVARVLAGRPLLRVGRSFGRVQGNGCIPTHLRCRHRRLAGPDLCAQPGSASGRGRSRDAGEVRRPSPMGSGHSECITVTARPDRVCPVPGLLFTRQDRGRPPREQRAPRCPWRPRRRPEARRDDAGERPQDPLARRNWTSFVRLRLRLTQAGYRVRARIINFAEFGVPQERFRGVILARKGLAPTFPDAVRSVGTFSTVRDWIGNLPPSTPGVPDPLDPMHETSRHRPATVELISKVPKDGGSRPIGLGPRCLDDTRRIHGGYTDVYGRLAWAVAGADNYGEVPDAVVRPLRASRAGSGAISARSGSVADVPAGLDLRWSI